MRRSCLRTPGRGGGRKGTGRSGRSDTGPLPAPRRAEESGPRAPQFLYHGAAPHQRRQYSTAISRINREEMRASCRLMPFGRVAASVTPCGRRGRPQRVKSLRSKVNYHLAAIPPHRSRGKPRPPCSGQQGSGSPCRWRRECQSARSWPSATPQHPRPASPRAASHTLRGGNRQCTGFAAGDILRGSLAMGRPGPGPGGRLPTARPTVFVGGREPQVSRPLYRQSQWPPHTSRPPPGPTLRCAPCPWSLADLQAAPHNRHQGISAKHPASTVLPARLPTTKAALETYAPRAVRIRAPYHARRTVPRINIYHMGAAADAAAFLVYQEGGQPVSGVFHTVEKIFKKVLNSLKINLLFSRKMPILYMK